MKKLLVILASVSTIALPVTTVIACGTSSSPKRFDIPVLPSDLNDRLLMALLSDPSISPEIKGKYFNDIDFKKAVTTMLEDRVSKLANNYYQNGINKTLMLNNQSASFYDQSLDNTIDAIAQNQFYLEYTKNLVSNSEAPLDIQIHIGNNGLISLNPSKLLQPDDITEVKDMDRNDYFVFYKSGSNWNRWEYLDENGNNNPQQIPTIQELETSQFVIIKKIAATDQDQLTDADINSGKLIWLDGNTRHDDPTHFVYSLDGKAPFFMNGKVALQYRFQEYFRSQIRYSTDDKKSLAKRMLAISYLEANLFNVYRNETSDFNRPINDEYLNINSDVAQSIQTWNKNVGYQSKLKMVWSFTMNSLEDAKSVWKYLQDNNYLNNDGSLTNSNLVSLKAIYNQLKSAAGPNITNQSNLGSDPFFNLNGYNGIVKNDKENIVSVDGNLVIDEAAKAKVFKANSPSIITKSLGDPFKSNVNGKYDFVFVMPIYLIDLLNEKTKGYDHGLNTTIYIPKADVQKSLNSSKVYTSFSEAQSQGNQFNSLKIDDINRVLGSDASINEDTSDYYIFDSMGASYTLAQWNSQNGTSFTPQNVWTTLATDTNTNLNGLQVAVKNTHGTTYGNIGIGNPVRLAQFADLPQNTPGLSFTYGNDGYVYVTANDPTFVGQVQSFTVGGQQYYLSFDPATKEGLITTTGTINKTNSTLNNTTYGDRVNMGQNSGNPNGYIEDENIPFNYYEANITSLDITNLNTANKTSLLKEIESVVAKDEAVINRASTAIYPLFLSKNDILFNPLYESLKKYLINEGGGSSD